MVDGPIDGELFRRNYLRSPVKLADSERARRRLNKLFSDSIGNNDDAFVSRVERRLGLEYPYWNGPNHDKFWTKAELGDVLSAITIWLQIIKCHPPALKAARDILVQEDLHYRIDDQGGVHFLVDQEFSATVETTIAGLRGPEFNAARHALEAGLSQLGAATQSGKGLIRGVFEAAESTFLVVIGPGHANRLNKQSVDKYLKPLLLTRYKTVPEAEDKVTRLLETFNSWVGEAHPYRHGAPYEQIHEAPLDLAILSASSGMGFIRFLAGIHGEVVAA